MVDNNFRETFNASIRIARFELIISMLDDIKEDAMKTSHLKNLKKRVHNIITLVLH